jgi:hypothetical protein
MADLIERIGTLGTSVTTKLARCHGQPVHASWKGSVRGSPMHRCTQPALRQPTDRDERRVTDPALKFKTYSCPSVANPSKSKIMILDMRQDCDVRVRSPCRQRTGW